jgi:hypothetical protein
MIKRAVAIAMLLCMFFLLLSLLCSFSIAPGSFRVWGTPPFFTIYEDAPLELREKLEIKNIMMVFSVLSIVVFYTGYLWGISKREIDVKKRNEREANKSSDPST